MSLQGITIILGLMIFTGGVTALLRPELICRFVELFPRSSIPAWIFTALCCWLGGREAQAMNMGSVGVIKPYIPVMSAVVFFSSVVFMKELLAPRALGGFLLLIAVPIVRTASMSGAPAFQILVGLVYLWIILGIILLMSPWYFRKFYEPFLKNKRLLKMATLTKTALGIILLMLGIFVY